MKKPYDTKQVHISHIEQGEIKQEQVTRQDVKSTIVIATLSSSREKDGFQRRESIKEELEKKLELQRSKIREETKRSVASREAWLQHLAARKKGQG